MSRAKVFQLYWKLDGIVFYPVCFLLFFFFANFKPLTLLCPKYAPGFLSACPNLSTISELWVLFCALWDYIQSPLTLYTIVQAYNETLNTVIFGQ